MKTISKQMWQLKTGDKFIDNDVIFVVVKIKHNIIFYRPIDAPIGCNKMTSQAGNYTWIEVVDEQISS